MKKRQGYSLVECLVAIGLISATLSTVAVATSGMYRCCQRVRGESVTELELERLAAGLRADAHQALSVKLDGHTDTEEAVDTLVLTLADERSVQYTLRAQRVERVLHYGDEVRHRETYRLPASFTARWEIERNRLLPMASLLLDPGPVGSNSPLGFQAMRIDAAVGLLQPLLAPRES